MPKKSELIKNLKNYWRNQLQRKRSLTVILIFSFVLIVFSIVFIVNFYNDLNEHLFEEHQNHIIEFTEKISEIIDGVANSSWNQVHACNHVVSGSGDQNTIEDLSHTLEGTDDFIDFDQSMVIAFDENGNYYSSDGGSGYWTSSEILSEQRDSKQMIVEVPHIKNNVYFFFMERLSQPIKIKSVGTTVTHIAIAQNTESIRSLMSVSGFGDKCLSYIINSDGRCLYNYTFSQDFIDSYNVLRAVENYRIVNGGSYDDLQSGKSTALEFEYVDEHTGKAERWFVSNSAIKSMEWQVLLFVPTEVLGANTDVLMGQTFMFFVVLIIILSALLGMILFICLSAQADKRLMEEKEKANVALASAAKEAQSANSAKSEFLLYMSHDIRTPINGIMGMTEIAFKHIENKERIFDCLTKIQNSSNHLLNLINDVLSMSRIESGKTKAEHKPFNLRLCAENCSSIVEGQFSGRDLVLIKDFDGIRHPQVIGDELHLRQVFINILGNSVKFTPDGGKIYFRINEIGAESEKAVFQFELEDTGIGMSPEFLPHIFEAFRQEENSSRTNYNGTGLGMSITKRFMELMGGTIQVESTPHVGTKFTLKLPIEVDFEERADEPVSDEAINISGMKVLAVEDNELNLEIVCELLADQNVSVTTAVNGKLAVEAFENNPPGTFDVILMDIMMPVMDGLTAAKTIRSLNRPDAKTIPILALTANAYDDDVRKTKEAGMNAHLPKPLNSEDLYKALYHYFMMPTLSGKRALVVEDNELNAEIAQEFLQAEGVFVTCAENGQKAVEAVKNSGDNMYDFILMDINMPVMNGIDASKAIRKLEIPQANSVPIFGISANIDGEDDLQLKDAGMDGFLGKPIEISALLALLSEIKRKRAVRKDSEKSEEKK